MLSGCNRQSLNQVQKQLPRVSSTIKSLGYDLCFSEYYKKEAVTQPLFYTDTDDMTEWNQSAITSNSAPLA